MKIRPRPASRAPLRGVAADEAWVVASALAVALVLGGLSLPKVRPIARPCAEPRMLPGVDGTRLAEPPAVACDADGRSLPAVSGPARLLFGRALDPNRAAARSLEVLPGIGPLRAAAIVRERQQGHFESLESLQRVPGIGSRTVARLAGWVAVPASPGSRRPVGADPSGPR